MTSIEHLDDETLITIIITNDAASRGAAFHIDQCSICRHELEVWRRISDLAQVSVASVPPAGAELDEQVFGLLGGPERQDAALPTRRPVFRYLDRRRRARWLISVPLAVVAIILAVTIGSGSTAPSDALVLATIRNSPAAAATLTHHFTSETVLRAPPGYVAIEYHDHGADSPHSNAFEITSTEIEPDGPRINPTTIVSDGSFVYLPCEPGWRSIGQKPCVAYPAQGGAPGSLADLRTAHGPVVRLGERKVDGVETTGYGVAVSVSAMVDTLIPSERSLSEYDNATLSDVHMKVWSDSRGLARELDLTWLERQPNLPALLHGSETEQLSYSKAPLRVSVPNRSTVTFVPNVTAAINLENQYQNELSACSRMHTVCNG
jgi:hypothetical protein